MGVTVSICWFSIHLCQSSIIFAWWRHQMEAFSALLVICAGNTPVSGKFPIQRPVTRSFDVFFDLHLNKRLSKQSWGWWFETPSWSLWPHRNCRNVLTWKNNVYHYSYSIYYEICIRITLCRVSLRFGASRLYPYSAELYYCRSELTYACPIASDVTLKHIGNKSNEFKMQLHGEDNCNKTNQTKTVRKYYWTRLEYDIAPIRQGRHNDYLVLTRGFECRWCDARLIYYGHYALCMMTSSNGNIFRVTGPLCGEFTGRGDFPTQRPVKRSFGVFFVLRPNKRLSKQPWGWWFETPSWSLWCQCNDNLP